MNIDINQHAELKYHCFIFQGDSLLLRDGESATLPPVASAEELGLIPECSYEIGSNGGGRVVTNRIAAGVEAPSGYSWARLRSLFGAVDEELFRAAGQAFQVAEWDRTTRHCGVCGALNEHRQNERVAVCPKCGFEQYPRVSPAMICAVVKGDKLLLAQNARYRGGHYSVVAGFVEAGETLEECVAREVMEETGLVVDDIRYFASQPWPFPHSLMVAFTAKWNSGDIHIDPAEIADAGWYRADEIGDWIPGKPTVARKLIDWFLDNHH